MKQGFDTFEQLRDDANKNASEAGALHAFGFGANGETFHREEEIAKVLRSRLTRGGIGREVKEKLGDDLVERMVNLLGKDVQNLFKDMERKDVIYTMLDRITLGLVNENDIDAFLLQHGYHIHDEADRRKLYEILQEAVEFYNNYVRLHTPDRRPVPTELSDPIEDQLTSGEQTPEAIYNLLQASAGHKPKRLIPYACAILRIAYVIWYMEHDNRLRNLDAAHAACQDIKSKIESDPALRQFILSVAIRTKSRWSTIAKLLHKPQNRADEVLDQEGFEILCANPAAAIQAIYMLFFDREHALFPDTTIRVDDTKDLLIAHATNGMNAKNVQELIQAAIKDPTQAEMVFAQLGAETHIVADEEPTNGSMAKSNKHSSDTYRAIKIIFEHIIRDNDGKLTLFPLELRVVDKQSHRANQANAPHESYKKNQGKAVAERILRNNLHERWNKLNGRGASHTPGAKRKKLS